MKFILSEPFLAQYETALARFSQFRFVKMGKIGESAGGIPIRYLKFGGDHCVLFLAGMHSLEYITVMVILQWFFQLCASKAAKSDFFGFDISRAFENKGVVILPLVNPDGTNIAFGSAPLSPIETAAVQRIANGDRTKFNCNLNGVDLNHNFSAGWQQLKEAEIAANITGPAPKRFGGYAPESEPETAAVIAACRKFCPRHAVSLHSQGEVIYYQFGKKTPEHAQIMAHILSVSCGYNLVQEQGLEIGGGFLDWFIETYDRPAFTFELGKGENPLPLSTVPSICKRISETLLIASLM